MKSLFRTKHQESVFEERFVDYGDLKEGRLTVGNDVCFLETEKGYVSHLNEFNEVEIFIRRFNSAAYCGRQIRGQWGLLEEGPKRSSGCNADVRKRQDDHIGQMHLGSCGWYENSQLSTVIAIRDCFGRWKPLVISEFGLSCSEELEAPRISATGTKRHCQRVT